LNQVTNEITGTIGTKDIISNRRMSKLCVLSVPKCL